MQTSTLVTIASGNLARSPAEEYRYDEEPAELTQNATTARCVLLVESDWEGDSENETLKYWSQFDGQRVIVGLSDLRRQPACGRASRQKQLRYLAAKLSGKRR